MINGLSYGCHTGSLAYPMRNRSREVFNSDMATVIIELVHPNNLGVLPPSPRKLAYLGEYMGIAKYSEFWRTQWY